MKVPSESQVVGKRSIGESLTGIQMAMESEGYLISVAELANFYLAMTVSPLVILSGISGTGKSLLPRKFAKQTNSFFMQSLYSRSGLIIVIFLVMFRHFRPRNISKGR